MLKSFDLMGLFAECSSFPDKIGHIRPLVAVFGSARLGNETQTYQQAHELASQLSRQGISILTGGGPGIMEAANRGARGGRGRSLGLCIHLPFEEGRNVYVEPDLSLEFKHFAARKIAFFSHADAFVVFAGGFGTLDELFETWMLMQTGHMHPKPIFLIGKSFWTPLLAWMNDTLVETKTIAREDMDSVKVTDSLEEVYEILMAILHLPR